MGDNDEIDDYVNDDIDDDDDDNEDEEVAEGDEEPVPDPDENQDEDEDPDLAKLEDEYMSDHEDDVLNDFQKMIGLKGKQEFRTHNFTSKYENAAAIGYRAQQIAEGAPVYTEVGNLTDASSIAAKEFFEGVMPIQIDRPLPSQKVGKPTYETRKLNELINVHQLM